MFMTGVLCTVCGAHVYFMSFKVLKPINFLKGNNADNSSLILLGLEKQSGMTIDA